MGWKDAEWAYRISLPLMQKVTLVALCHRTDDKTHETIVGQSTLAQMIGGSADSVRRALAKLEEISLIERHRRTGLGGFRTSDRIVVNVAYQAENLQGALPTRQRTYKAGSGDLTGSQPPPTQTSAGAEEITQIGHSVKGHSVKNIDNRFDEFYAVWPRKVKKTDAQRAWDKALKKTTAEVIIEAAVAYRDNPGRPEMTFIPYPATWLNGERWNDELDTPRPSGRPDPDARLNQTLDIGDRLQAQMDQALNVKEIGS